MPARALEVLDWHNGTCIVIGSTGYHASNSTGQDDCHTGHAGFTHRAYYVMAGVRCSAAAGAIGALQHGRGAHRGVRWGWRVPPACRAGQRHSASVTACSEHTEAHVLWEEHLVLCWLVETCSKLCMQPAQKQKCVSNSHDSQRSLLCRCMYRRVSVGLVVCL